MLRNKFREIKIADYNFKIGNQAALYLTCTISEINQQEIWNPVIWADFPKS